MEDTKKEILMKNNKLIKTRYNLNHIQNKVFQLILFKCQRNSNDLFVAHIHKSEFEVILANRNHKTIKGISKILQTLRKADIWIYEGTKWENHGFIGVYGYDETNNIFTIKMFKEIYDLLMSYLNGYTPINLDVYFQFKSFYSQKFYELLRIWSNSKTIINYSIEELRELLMLENKYSIYRDFKKRVIEPARKELNEKGLMKIDIKENKKDRKVISIDFIVQDLDNRKYFNKKSDKVKEIKESNTHKKDKRLKFNNFDQRQYDYDKLEKQLLGWECD